MDETLILPPPTPESVPRVRQMFALTHKTRAGRRDEETAFPCKEFWAVASRTQGGRFGNKLVVFTVTLTISRELAIAVRNAHAHEQKWVWVKQEMHAALI